MSNIIKPIETLYKGYRFRSRLEARWAVCFDYCKVKWEYEAQGYKLPSGNYLPDFYLPISAPHTSGGDAFSGFVEIKNKSSIIGIKKFDPNPGLFWNDHPKHWTREECLAFELALLHKTYVFICYGDPLDCFEEDMSMLQEITETVWSSTKLRTACLKARQARFEHGETP